MQAFDLLGTGEEELASLPGRLQGLLLTVARGQEEVEEQELEGRPAKRARTDTGQVLLSLFNVHSSFTSTMNPLSPVFRPVRVGPGGGREEKSPGAEDPLHRDWTQAWLFPLAGADPCSCSSCCS